MEIVFENLYNFWREITGIKNIKIFTFCLTFLSLFFFLTGWEFYQALEVFIFNTEKKKSIFLRTAYSDINITLALAIISVLGVNILEIYKLG